MHGMRDYARQIWHGDEDQLQPRSKTLSLVRKVIDKIVRLSADERPDLLPGDVRRSCPEPGSPDRLLPEPFDLGWLMPINEKDIAEAIRRKEVALSIVRDQITALKLCIPLLADDSDDAILAESAQTRS